MVCGCKLISLLCLLTVVFVCTMFTIHSQSVRLAPEAEPLALAHGCVNVITGDFIQQETDLFIDAASPLHLSRTYDSGNANALSPIGHGFTWAIARSIKSYSFQFVDIEEREGIQIPCFFKFKQGALHYELHPDIFESGYTNYSSDGIDAADSLHNVTLQHHSRRRAEDDVWVVTLGCGTKRFYQAKMVCNERCWHLSKEIRPDGNRIFYEFDKEHRIQKAWLTDSIGSTPLISYSVQYQGNDVIVSSPNGKNIRYIVKKNEIKIRGQKYRELRLNKVEANHLTPVEYHYPDFLLAKALVNASDEPVISTHLVYDEQGNVIRETLLGNLSGTGSPTHNLNKAGEPQGDGEKYATIRKYLPVFNVLTEEEGDDGSCTQYRYKEGTNLITAKLQGKSKIFAREFFTYDQYANQIRHIVDDGSGSESGDLTDVLVRTITEIDPVTTPLSPAFGKPTKKRGKYYENGNEIALHTIHYHYDDLGYPIQEDHYDAKNALSYSLQRLYDPAGRVLEETDPLGHKTTHAYDANGNKILTTIIDQDITIEYYYDYCNRLINETEIHPHKSYTTTHRYDLSSRKIATIDPFGNETLYTHDELGRITSVTHPKVNGQCGVERYEYDLADNKTAVYNVSGDVTRTTFTARGQPICVIYPDGSQENHLYNVNGLLDSHTAVNGVITKILYDPFLRPTRKLFQNEKGEDLYETLIVYTGSKVTSEIDANGVPTNYKYDGAGRLIESSKGNQRTQYAYDSLGHQHQITEWIDEHTCRITIREYDLLNRLVEECIKGGSGILYKRDQYEYDPRGNCILHRVETSQGTAETKTEYDSRHRPILVTDALGNSTTTKYEEDFDVQTLRITVTDPLHNKTITVQNSVGQIVQQFREDGSGHICAQSEHVYDVAGRKIRQCDTAMAPGLPDRKIVTEWAFDKMGRVITLSEAVGAPEQKLTQYSYNTKGQKTTVTLPDGIRLKHKYDCLGRLQRYSASDKSFNYFYEYDLNNNVVNVFDALNKTHTQRLYDDNNRILYESLGNGLALSYTYDGLHRPLQVKLPDDTFIDYTYDACHLKTVTRPIYEHHYILYDFSGVLLEELSPVGEIYYAWDLLNRPRLISSTHFTETIPDNGYDAASNLLRKQRQDRERTIDCEYTYDPLYQLRSETTTDFEPYDYVYDSLHNRRLRNKEEYTLDHLNRLLKTEEATYTYDKRGNLIEEETSTNSVKYRYDALGRLTSLTRNELCYEYQYDAYNRRIKKTTPQSTERYLYLDQNEIGMVDQQGKIVQLRVLGQGKGAEIGSAIALELDDQIYIPIHDHCGHVSVLIDLETKNLTEAYVYTAFGEEHCYGMKTTNPWHFSSKRLDPESGWIYFGRRYYDPKTGRWTTPDPIGFADGPNLYAYVKNNPLTHFDLYGLQTNSGMIQGYFQQMAQSAAQGFRSRVRNITRRAASSAGTACRKVAAKAKENVRVAGAGVGHGCVDFATDTYHGTLQAAAYMGSMQLENFSIQEHSEFMSSVAQTHAQQAARLDAYVQNLTGIDPNHSIYQTTRYRTNMALTVASIAYGAYGAMRGGLAIWKASQVTQVGLRVASTTTAVVNETRPLYVPKCPQTGKPLPLPRNGYGVNIPSSDTPHTQIGWRDGTKGSYRQTRQWGYDGKPTKTTDWTDHRLPLIHDSPHDHVFNENSTGGTLNYGNPVPFRIIYH